MDQYNGNIKAISWNTNTDGDPGSADTYYYQYDKNNWLQGASFNQSLTSASEFNRSETRNMKVVESEEVLATYNIDLEVGFEIFAADGRTFEAQIVSESGEIDAQGDYNVYGITYDANGNIQSLNRNKNTVKDSNVMDQLTYRYKADKPNQLLRVEDAVGTIRDADDIESQEGENYVYNEIGQLVQNHKENITYLYNASGLVTEVQKDENTLVKFFYNDKGHRVRKDAFPANGGPLTVSTFYIRDASGSPLAIYTQQTDKFGVQTDVEEYSIYGASRLGIYKPQDNSSLYQLTDHLGNVRAVMKKDVETGDAIAATATDYYPFGMPMPGPNNIAGAEKYRYAYQGQEKDEETGKEAFELRFYDSRIGRWLTPDPKNEFSSPYLAMGNNPILRIDPDGGMTVCPDGDCINGGSLEEVIITGPGRKSGWLSRLQDLAINTGQTVLVVGAGSLNAWGSNQVLGAGRSDPTKFGEFELAFRAGQLIGDVASIVTGHQEIVTGAGLAGGGLLAEIPSAGTSTVPLAGGVALAGHGASVATLGTKNTAEGIAGLVDYFARNKHGKGGFDFKKLSDSLVKSLGLDAHAIKKEFLGNKTSISKYDLYKDNGTGEIWIFLKGGKGEGIPTGYFAN